jgi:hypothetical protein
MGKLTILRIYTRCFHMYYSRVFYCVYVFSACIPLHVSSNGICVAFMK